MISYGNDAAANLGPMVPAESLRSANEWLTVAAKNDFREIQLNLCWRPLEWSELRELKSVLSSLRLRCRTLGVYCDMLRARTSHPYFDTSINELKRAIEWSSEVTADSVIGWSGSYAKDLLGRDWRNQTSAARNSLKRHVESIMPLLEDGGIRLLFEPWHTHALGNEHELAAFCALKPQQIGCVLDLPNLVAPQDQPITNDRVTAIVKTRRPFVGIVHLHGVEIDTQGIAYLQHPRGRLEYSMILKAVSPLFGHVPFIIEHVLPEEVKATRNFFLERIKRVSEESQTHGE